METKYAMVREFLYGWDWSEFDENGQPIIYDNKKKAQASLDEYIKDVNDAYKSGNLQREYADENDMAIAEVKFNLINK
jgi:hypothetical protein